MEAAGVEPASGNASGRASTRVGMPFGGLASAGGSRPAVATSQLISTSRSWQFGRSSLIVSVFPSYRRKLKTPSLPGFIRQREQQRYRSQLQVCPFLRGLGRHGAQLERLHPRRIRYAPSYQRTEATMECASVTVKARCRDVRLRDAWQPRCANESAARADAARRGRSSRSGRRERVRT